jgi:hypothetical protein
MSVSGTKATDELETDATTSNNIWRLSAKPYTGSRRHPNPLPIKSLLVKNTLAVQGVKKGATDQNL